MNGQGTGFAGWCFDAKIETSLVEMSDFRRFSFRRGSRLVSLFFFYSFCFFFRDLN